MQQLLALADEIPWIMVPAIVIAATAAISIIVAGIKLSNPVLKAMLVAIILALSWQAMVIGDF